MSDVESYPRHSASEPPTIEGRVNAVKSNAVFYDINYVERIIKQNQELKRNLDLAVEVLEFYGNTESWKLPTAVNVGEKPTRNVLAVDDFAFFNTGGGRARKALKEIKGESD